MDKPAALAAIGALVYGYASRSALNSLSCAIPESIPLLLGIQERGRRGAYSATADEAAELTRLVNERFAKWLSE